ncbi:hypothetical protein GCM10010960_05410 [Arenimonas maotaiensis]|uniref:J domain-containing protein n=1 Tax=Arenimonas maotaiensis TaxID=1446479 RepID=A0A917CFJ0_9GAMM|nr:J domain-containing protein [Arenimonas maotaiensis]GGF86341.1 hypothetical protein GCM10010960_05410 [Arenimonas maotaiensis]
MIDGAAWQQARALQDAPETLFALRAARLPEGMTALIRLASADGAEADTAGAYLQAVCLYAGSPPWRCLGLAPGADPALAKEHHRLLIKWLHPDRNPEARVLAERVNAAWQALKAGALPVPVPRHAPPPMPPRARSRFPLFLAGLLAAGVLLLALSLWPQDQVYPESALPGPVVSAGEGAPAIAPQNLPLWAPEPATVAGVKASTAPAATPVQAMRAVSAAVASAPAEPAMRAAEPPAPPISAPAVSVAAEPVALAASEPNARAPARAQGEALLREFEQRYADGDLAAFMALFSAEASNGRGDVADIRRDYRRLFQRTRHREIAFSQARWRPGDDTLSVRLRYRAELGFGAARAPTAQQGGLELALALEDGRPRIVQYLLLE